VSAEVQRFLAMGGYAAFVWPAYGLTVCVLGGLLWWSLAAYRRSRRTLGRMQGGRAP
jgi:heme exporter protein D